MIRLSIKRKILGIAVGLILLMAAVSVLSISMVNRVSDRLEELTNSYIPAYGDLARANIRSLERALDLRRIIIDKLQVLPESQLGDIEKLKEQFALDGQAVEREMQSARSLIEKLIDKGTAFGDSIKLARMETHIEAALSDHRRHLNTEITRLLTALDSRDNAAASDSMARVDSLRDELDHKLDAIRADMLQLVRTDANATLRNQHQVLVIALVITAIAALLGLMFSALVSSGVTRPVRRLLDGTRAVEAGQLDHTVLITTQDEIGHLTVAFNKMVEQLRVKERIRETFGKYVDPRVVEGLIDRPVLGAEGERRVMTVLFCDMKGFTSISEGMTPQGLVKVMNRYLSIMSEPIRTQRGIIDKYIGDAIMAYWGPPFTAASEHAQLACSAALEMIGRVASLQSELPDLLAVRSVPIAVDIRIGIATGEVLVGSIGSELLMSYTVLGDAVNLAARLESANKVYGTRILVSEPTIKATSGIEAREIDRLAVLGQRDAQVVYEVMGQAGELTPEQLSLRATFSRGLAAYRAQRWTEAKRAFAEALAIAPDDGPSISFIRRIERLVQQPPPGDWDGSWRLDEK